MAVNKIFFSYSFKDEEEVLKVRELIESIVDEEGNQQYSVFMASDPVNGNKSGRSWNAQEQREMLNSFLVLYFLSDNSVISDGASQELKFYFGTMRKMSKAKFLYVSLNNKSMTESILDFMRDDASFVEDVLIEQIINRYTNMLDEPEFADNHLYIKKEDAHFAERVLNSILEMYNSYNGLSKKENKYKDFIKKLEKIESKTKEEIKNEKKEVKAQEKIVKKEENVEMVDPVFFDVFNKSEDEEIVKAKREIVKWMNNCLIDGEIDSYYVGNSYTLYELKVDRTTKMVTLKNNLDELSLSIGNGRIRLLAPIPGKLTCGLEVPNKVKTVLKFKELLTPEYLKKTEEFTCLMGKNVYGEIKAYNLFNMPHCLISGVQGSGAVGVLHTFIVSLLMKYTPNELKLVLTDPLQVEFNDYEDVPHLMYPIIKDASVGVPLFKEICEEIERRYKLLEQTRCKNIVEYHKTGVELPYMLIVINEYADLVLLNRDIENYITRIVTLGRAVGVHVLLYTQRASVDVLTGVMKANFATRISGVVPSFLDSRTILDEGGAEYLLGKGDMLVKYFGTTERIQTAYITPTELTAFCEAVVNKYGTTEKKEIPVVVEEKEDTLIKDIIDMLYEKGELSLSRMQMKFHIGYARGVHILEDLVEKGVVYREGSIARPNIFKEEAYKILKIK